MLMPFKFNQLAKAGYLTIVLQLLGFGLFAQKVVTGNVVNNRDNSPVSNASIQVKGTAFGTKTQDNGSFSINVPNDNSSLVITIVGFEKIEIPVLGKTSLGS